MSSYRAPRLHLLFLLALLGLSGCAVILGERPIGGGKGRTSAQAAVAPPAEAAPKSGESGTGPVALPGVVPGHENAAALTANKLQNELLAFTDRYREAVAEASDWGASHAESASSRAGFVELKVVYVTAAITIATESEPLRIQRDLLVMVRLQRMVWFDNAPPWASAESATRMQKALARLEQQIIKLAKMVFTDQDIETLHVLTQQWREENPERRYVAFVRFHDLEETEQKRKFESRITHSGLLAPINKANEELEDLRRVADRALFLANHMPMLLEWQAEAYLHGAMELPEVQALSQDFTRLSGSADRFSNSMDVLPERIAIERAETLRELAALLARERSAMLTQLGEQFRVERSGLMADLKSASTDLGPLVQHLAEATANTREALRLLSSLRSATADGEDIDLEAANRTVVNLTRLAGDTSQLLQTLHTVLADSEHAAAGFAQLDQLLQAHERRLFQYGLVLIALFGGFLCVAALLNRRRMS